MNNLRRLTIADINLISNSLASEFEKYNEPFPPFDSRYKGVLESCLNQPFQTFEGQDLYPNLTSKAAILFYLMIKNHPFKNGNKRIAVITFILFLFINGFWLETSNQNLYEFAKYVAKSDRDSKNMVIKDIEIFVKSNIIQKEAELDW